MQKRIQKTIALLFAVCLASFAPLAQAQLKEVQKLEHITELALPNGLQVLLVPDAAKPVTTVNITYRVGSRHEGRGETGAAHLLEHMLFKASGKVENPMRDMQSLGMRWNGTTGFDRTNYFAHFLANDAQAAERMDYMLGWLAGMMTQAKFTRADLDSEMTVVRNEFERAENEPGRVLGDRMRAIAYGAHGYAHSVLGLRSDIENIPLPALYAFYRKNYRPDNATLIVAGSFDAASTRARIEQAFGAIPKPTEPLADTYTLPPAQDGERSVVLRRVGGSASTSVLYQMPPGSTRQAVAARVLAEALQQRSGPLSKGLSNNGLAVTEWAWYQSTREPGYLAVGVGLPESKEPELSAIKSAAALARVVETVRLEDAEINTARQTLLSNSRALLRDAEATGQRLSEMVALGDWRLIFAQRDALADLKPEEVRSLASTWLVASNRTAGTYLPLTEKAPARAPTPQATAQVEMLDAMKLIANKDQNTLAPGSKPSENAAKAAFFDFSLTPEALQSRASRSRLDVGNSPGLKLALLPRAAKDDRVVGVLRLRWGSVESLKGSGVLATMLAPLLMEGTSSLTALQIKERLLALDARLSFSSSSGFLGAAMEFPAANREAYLELLVQILRDSKMDTASFERNQKAMLASMQGIKANTGSVAGNLLERSFRAYPEGDPREVRSFAQTEGQMRSATAADLRAYWQRFGNASYGELSLAGPVDARDVQAQLQAKLGDWVAREPYAAWLSTHAEPSAAKLQTVSMPDKANASYSARIAFPLNERDADYPALFAAVQLLSRQGLWERVREKEGLSYGVGALLGAPWEGDAGSINIGASFAPQNAAKLKTVIREVLVAKREQGFGSLEVGFAKSAIASRRAEWLAQPANAVANMAFNLRYDRPLDSYAQPTAAYAALDAATVNAALKKYLNPDAMVEVLVGTFE